MKLGSILKSVAVEKKTWHLTTTLTQTQCLTVRHDLVNLLNLFGRVLDHSFHRAVICNQFQQLGVCHTHSPPFKPRRSFLIAWTTRHHSRNSFKLWIWFVFSLSFTLTSSQLSTLCSHREEPLLAVAVLKGIDPQIVRDFRGTRDTPPLVIDWNNAALVYTFCEVASSFAHSFRQL